MEILGLGRRRLAGFTLIELMITIAVVAVLTTIAVSTYQSSVRKGNRRAAQAVMMDVNTVQQQYYMANRGYATWANLGYTLPTEVAANYETPVIELGQSLDSTCTVVASTVPSFVVTFSPKGRMLEDGTLWLGSDGRRCPADKW
ncbi:MAG: type IV pilin protein [Steroidobacteraceae bacterium]